MCRVGAKSHPSMHEGHAPAAFRAGAIRNAHEGERECARCLPLQSVDERGD
jgi:hypothetical protein